ncbi:MAG: hypothetical protein R2873_35950 [Caldilineaceae bacterium]
MAQRFCPHLGAPLEDESRGPAQDYPSFENRCYAVEWIQPAFDEMEREQLLLADQATYCLGSGHRLCPRFRLLAADDATDVAPAGDELALANEDAALPILADADMLLAADEDRRPRLGLWVGVATFLAIFMLCGGSLAVYTGWQLVGSGLLPFGERLAQVSAPLEQNQVFLLVTPTPSAPVGPPTAPILAQQILSPLPSPQPTFAFPVAVTPTPTSAIAAQILNNTANDAETPSTTGPVVITTPTPPSPDNGADNSEAPSDPALATAVAGPVIITTPGGPAAPTRRPTPTFAVPTSTPGDPAIVVVTATPTPVVTYAPAVVEFRAAHQFLPPQGCTTLFWRGKCACRLPRQRGCLWAGRTPRLHPVGVIHLRTLGATPRRHRTDADGDGGGAHRHAHAAAVGHADAGAHAHPHVDTGRAVFGDAGDAELGRLVGGGRR